MTLKELNDASLPLLRRLAQESPGTYQHSLTIGDMAQAAADAIGANGLLAKVGAMYHDIGKINKPAYFVENQGSGDNIVYVENSVAFADNITLPDLKNFQTAPGVWYDFYQGVSELMPFAKAVSAKTNVFDEAGNEREIDYIRMMRIVLEAGYRGYVGIEWEGTEISEPEGIRATKALLELAGFSVFGEAGRDLLEALRVEELGEEELALGLAPVERTRVRMSVSLALVVDPGGLELGREAEMSPESGLLFQEDAGEISRV